MSTNPTCKSPIEIIIKDHCGDNISTSKTSNSFLTRLHAGYFRISLSFGAQALLWNTLTQHKTTLTNDDYHSHDFWVLFRKLPSTAFLLLWCLAFLIHLSLSLVYILRCFFHFDSVKAEFSHHIGVNYVYVPWISWLILLQSAPLAIFPNSSSYQALCLLFALPIVILDLKIYGQWFTTEKKFLSIMANPTSQISVVGNLVCARAAAEIGWQETAVCMFSLGLVHYLVLFITLYQRLSGGNTFPAMLRPTFFLFFATPSMASLAWKSISGTFDTASKMLFFLSLFLFTSLVSRPALFRKSMKKFNVAWWAYSFALTFLALASAEYAKQVKGKASTMLMLLLSALSVLIFLGLFLFSAVKNDRLLHKTDPILSFGSIRSSQAKADEKK
ncbi:hypothetical protein ACFE04_030386 [Oxalis oulophora]